jgi:hypothetical protein
LSRLSLGHSGSKIKIGNAKNGARVALIATDRRKGAGLWIEILYERHMAACAICS